MSNSLPMTMDAHKEFAGSILALGAIPDNDSTRAAIAQIVLHTPQEKPLTADGVLLELQRSIVNQAAWGVLEEIKQRQASEAKAATEAADAAVTIETNPSEVQ